ncbi:MAG: ribokinase [Oscillospiraceae bacterium]|nr:ribokinase [Oscillospiraceae bacterium]
MKILNFGSINYDHVYTVPYIVRPGETLESTSVQEFIGGKGFNQSIALSRAGVPVYHAGAVGLDGGNALDALSDNGVDIGYIAKTETQTGKAIIQVSEDGQNSIILSGGANQCISIGQIDRTLENFTRGDILLLQNEISNVGYIIKKAHDIGMKVFLNPSPYHESLSDHLCKVDLLFINEVEGMQITGSNDPDLILDKISSQYPDMRIVLTLGPDGVAYRHGAQTHRHGIFKGSVIDTTAAGDTFTGHFIGAQIRGEHVTEALKQASAASSLAISASGAYPSIPTIAEVMRRVEGDW